MTTGLRRGRYGCERFQRLRRAILHRPGDALRVITKSNYRKWLFEQVPDVGRFNEEHDRYRELLVSQGIEVVELSNLVEQSRGLMSRLPNLTYLHDTAVISSKGAILSAMAREGRSGEELVVREALGRLGVPIAIDFADPGDAFEGCLLLSPTTVLVANTERHRRSSIDKFIAEAAKMFDEVIYVDVPQARRYMHPDTIFNRVDHRLALAYPPAFKSTCVCAGGRCEQVDFLQHMRSKGIEIVCVSDVEQRKLACSFVPLEPGVILHYDCALDRRTQSVLRGKGVELVLFHPVALLSGGGSLRCMTLMLHRDGP